MPQLPSTPAPSSVKIKVHQPSAKSYSVSGKPQSRSSGLHSWEVTFSYKGLEFSERDSLMASLAALTGRVTPTNIIVPTHSENSGILTSATATASASYPAGSSVITLNNIDGELRPFNLISVNGDSKVYSVSSPSTVVAGTQTVTVTPPLRVAVASGAVFNVKDVPIYAALDSDTINADSSDMQANIDITFVEEL